MAIRRNWRLVAMTCAIAAGAIFVAPLVVLLSLFMPPERAES